MPHIYFTVTNDLDFDQRMQRICTSLAGASYTVTLVGRRLSSSQESINQSFKQKRLKCWFNKGPLFYFEFQLRLFFFLLFRRMDGICAIDLDTILPCYFISRLKRIPRIYDAHELFCEMKEVAERPGIYRIWKWIERFTLPRFKNGYTVNHLIAAEFERMYGVKYSVIRSVPLRRETVPEQRERFILYQGAVNEGRCFEALIPAMRQVDAELVICGTGNFFLQAKALAQSCGVSHKVHFRGMVLPDELRKITRKAFIGITLFDKNSKSNYWSLANRFFDYIHAGVPQVAVDYPLYREINNTYRVAVLVSDPTEINIAFAINSLLKDQELWQHLHSECEQAGKEFNWQEEEKQLISFYKNIFG